eukprot:1165484-Pyramimonas_sp.AAC.1
MPMIKIKIYSDNICQKHPQTVRRVGELARLTGDNGRHKGWLELGCWVVIHCLPSCDWLFSCRVYTASPPAIRRQYGVWAGGAAGKDGRWGSSFGEANTLGHSRALMAPG